MKPGILRLYARGLVLRCPHCGHGGLLQSWFRLRPKCPGCGLRLDRGEEDFFFGGMMWNLVLAEGLLAVVLVLVVISTWPGVPWTLLQWGAPVLMILAPLALYPVSLATWLATDLILRPLSNEELAWHRRSRPDEFRPQRDR